MNWEVFSLDFFHFLAVSFKQAVELDDSDIYTMNKLGQLALSMGRLETAQVAFEKVFFRNFSLHEIQCYRGKLDCFSSPD